MGCRLYVGNLSFATDESQLREFFSTGGRVVTSIDVVMDRETGRPRGFAFVEMGSESAARATIDEFNGATLGGRTLTVSEARERERRGGPSHGR
jgi:cold-inducible RNA-binding protein